VTVHDDDVGGKLLCFPDYFNDGVALIEGGDDADDFFFQ
jgi:hypothetical protein